MELYPLIPFLLPSFFYCSSGKAKLHIQFAGKPEASAYSPTWEQSSSTVSLKAPGFRWRNSSATVSWPQPGTQELTSLVGQQREASKSVTRGRLMLTFIYLKEAWQMQWMWLVIRLEGINAITVALLNSLLKSYHVESRKTCGTQSVHKNFIFWTKLFYLGLFLVKYSELSQKQLN